MMKIPINVSKQDLYNELNITTSLGAGNNSGPGIPSVHGGSSGG